MTDQELAEAIACQHAQAQQNLCAAVDVARLLGAFRRQLVRDQFDAEQAFQLARDYLGGQFDMSMPTLGDPSDGECE